MEIDEIIKINDVIIARLKEVVVLQKKLMNDKKNEPKIIPLIKVK
jgi:hypothetical protein